LRRSIKKVLIANRGEIALRVIRACHEMGIATVAVYSDADRGALHVLHADEAYRLGPAPAAESYLRGDLILEVARRAGADAIHPGYGFLSENADFAEACAAAGVTFIGPPASAMRVLGSKTRARQAADVAQMPRVPGSVTGLADVAEAVRVAAGIGYPVMLKAAAGGGGKGMRAVARAEELGAAFTAVRVRCIWRS
jgi:acetyl-CoA carboxylase biotin carboxylase subunit